MSEISNSTLALFVVAAIVVSVFGTLMSLNRLNQLGGASGLTGFATSASGTANLSVSSAADIVLLDNLVELGTLQQNKSNSSEQRGDYFRVKNEGGVNISIEVYASTQGTGIYANSRGYGPFTLTSAPPTNGCVNAAAQIHTCMLLRCNSTMTGSCNSTYYYLHNETSQGNLIVDLAYADGTDEATFAVNATVPINEPAGNKQQAITFAAASSD